MKLALPYLHDVKAPGDDRRTPPSLTIATSARSRVASRGAKAYLSTYGGDNAIDWAMDCARLIMESASNAVYHFRDPSGSILRAEADANSPDDAAPADLAELFAQPNPYSDYVEMIELSIIDLLFAGEFLWWKFEQGDDFKPLALWRLNPSLVDVIPGRTQLVAGYEFRAPGLPKPVQIPADQVVHVKLPNPHDPYRGLSVIAGGGRAIDIELSLTETQATFFEQGTHLGGVLSSDRRVPDVVFDKIKRQFEVLYGGRRNAGKVAILEQGLKFQAVQATAQEAQFEALSKLSRDRVAHMFRVPLPLIGNMENANYKMAEAQRIFDTKTMRPMLNRIQRRLSTEITQPGWGLDFQIEYEYVMPDEDRLRLAESVASIPGVRVHEVREQAGLGRLGDERDEVVLNLPVEGEPQPGALHSREGGRPSNPENVPGFQPTGAQTEQRLLNPGPGTKAPAPRAAAMQRPEAERASLAQADTLAPAREFSVEANAAELQAEITAAAAELADALAEALSAPDVKAAKKPDRAPTILDRLTGTQAWSRFAERVRAAAHRAAIRAQQDAEAQYSLLGLTPSQEDIRAQALALADRATGIKSITGTLRERVLREIREGLRRGYSPAQLTEGVPAEGFGGLRGLFEDYRTGQAETIAITEATAYYNGAALDTAERSGVAQVLVLDGQDHDQPCIDAHGATWTVEHARDNLYEHPRCRRAFIPVTT